MNLKKIVDDYDDKNIFEQQCYVSLEQIMKHIVDLCVHKEHFDLNKKKICNTLKNLLCFNIEDDIDDFVKREILSGCINIYLSNDGELLEDYKYLFSMSNCSDVDLIFNESRINIGCFLEHIKIIDFPPTEEELNDCLEELQNSNTDNMDKKSVTYYRKVFAYKEYFFDYYNSLYPKAQKAIDKKIEYLKTEKILNEQKVDKLIEDVYELRAKQSSNIYRIAFMFDKVNIVVFFNGWTKKSQKTSREEIDRALRIRNMYKKESKCSLNEINDSLNKNLLTKIREDILLGNCNLIDLDDILSVKYGEIGTEERTLFSIVCSKDEGGFITDSLKDDFLFSEIELLWNNRDEIVDASIYIWRGNETYIDKMNKESFVEERKDGFMFQNEKVFYKTKNESDMFDWIDDFSREIIENYNIEPHIEYLYAV